VLNLIVIFGLFEWIQQTTENINLATMAVNALVAAETFYLLSISQFVQCLPTGVIKLNRLAMHLQLGLSVSLFYKWSSRWSLMNQLFGTVPKFCSSSNLCRRLTYYFVALLKRFAPMK